MNFQNKPESFGVFKPVGHVIMTFPSNVNIQSVETTLLDAGFPNEDICYCNSEEMIEQIDKDIEKASFLASLGQEMNLIKSHREQAQTRRAQNTQLHKQSLIILPQSPRPGLALSSCASRV